MSSEYYLGSLLNQVLHLNCFSGPEQGRGEIKTNKVPESKHIIREDQINRAYINCAAQSLIQNTILTNTTSLHPYPHPSLCYVLDTLVFLPEIKTK